MAVITASLSSLTSEATGDVAWTNATNAGASDDAYATAQVSAVAPATEHLVGLIGSAFDAIPDTARLISVVAKIEAKYAGAISGIRIDLVKAWDGAAVQGDDQTTGQALTTSDAVYSIGSGAWGWWTVARLKTSTNGMAVQCLHTAGVSPTVSIDHVQLEVTYDDWPRNSLGGHGRSGRGRGR